jgi:hypothetical protein
MKGVEADCETTDSALSVKLKSLSWVSSMTSDPQEIKTTTNTKQIGESKCELEKH